LVVVVLLLLVLVVIGNVLSPFLPLLPPAVYVGIQTFILNV